jgi:small subunit ribosomal protein S13
MPVRISGVDIPEKKQVLYALTSIKGIGKNVSANILDQANIDKTKDIKNLTEAELKRIREIIDKNYQTEGDLRLEVNQNIRRLKDIGSYKGDRHKKNLPVHGQRTKTNARTKRGRRVTVGSGRKPAAEKT